MEEHGLENFEDPSDIIEDVVEISVENSVEVNLLPVNNNSEVSAARSYQQHATARRTMKCLLSPTS